LRARRFAPLALLLLSGCPEEPKDCFVGDRALDPEIEVVYRGANGALVPVTDGTEVPLILPPQGGKVMLVGVRAKNLDGCPLTLRTAIRDVCNNGTISTEGRPVAMEKKGEWLEPVQPIELSNYSNLPACPKASLTRDLHGNPYKLIVIVEDKDKRRAEKQLIITPTCSEPEFEEQCRCECSMAYNLGDACDPSMDAGTSSCAGDAGM
jgi:hypothetical protein